MSTRPLYINGDRLKNHLVTLGQIGYEEGKGVTRMAYSDEFYKGQRYISKLMSDASLEVEIDSVGNVIGTKKGDLESFIVLGSHIDSVPEGGIFDGCLGVLGAIECIQTLAENNYNLRYGIKVISFAEEEGNVVGGLLGSKAFAGLELGDSIMDNIGKANITLNDIKMSKNKSKIDYYIELHIEQGGILDSTNNDIGIVSAIVGIKRYLITIDGFANHAGSTPMYLRNDALVKAAKLIVELDESVREIDKDMVCTVGYLKVVPGAYNVIPGKVILSLELRSVNTESMDSAISNILEKFGGEDFHVEKIFDQAPVFMDDDIKSHVKMACENLGLKAIEMHSGAGHDTMSMAAITKPGMIFAPSKGGISHSKDELTMWSDVTNSTNVLLNTIISLDKS